MKNKKLLSVLTASALALTSFALVGCNKDKGDGDSTKYANAYISLDINPAIEILTDEKGNISRVTGVNDDGKTVILDLDLTGKSYKEAVSLLLAEAKALGYLDGLTAGIVETYVQAGDGTNLMTDGVKTIVEKFLTDNNLTVTYKQKDLTKTDAKTIAENNSISIDKAQLVLVLSDLTGAKTTEEISAYAKLSTDKLHDMIEDEREKREDFYSEELEEKYDMLEDQIENLETQEEYKVILAEVNKLTADSNGDITINSKKVNKASLVALLTTLNSSIETAMQTTVDGDRLLTEAQQADVLNILKEMKTLEEQMQTALTNKDKNAYETAEEDYDTKEDELEEILDDAEENMGEDEIDFEVYLGADGESLSIVANVQDAIEDEIEEAEGIFENALEDLNLDDDDLEDAFETLLDKIDVETALYNKFATDNAQAIADAETALRAEKAKLKDIYDDED